MAFPAHDELGTFVVCCSATMPFYCSLFNTHCIMCCLNTHCIMCCLFALDRATAVQSLVSLLTGLVISLL